VYRGVRPSLPSFRQCTDFPVDGMHSDMLPRSTWPAPPALRSAGAWLAPCYLARPCDAHRFPGRFTARARSPPVPFTSARIPRSAATHRGVCTPYAPACPVPAIVPRYRQVARTPWPAPRFLGRGRSHRARPRPPGLWSSAPPALGFADVGPGPTQGTERGAGPSSPAGAKSVRETPPSGGSQRRRASILARSWAKSTGLVS
jgi:hypothetical protein